jgi:hypothetical protein
VPKSLGYGARPTCCQPIRVQQTLLYYTATWLHTGRKKKGKNSEAR